LEDKQVLASLPNITSEIGNTWVYGTPADPFRVSQFREISRVVKEEFSISGMTPYLDKIMRRLLVIPEHNWGKSLVKQQNFPHLLNVYSKHHWLAYPDRTITYAQAALNAKATSPWFTDLTEAVIDQRSYLDTKPGNSSISP